MAKDINEIVGNLANMEGVRHTAVVSKDDGSILQTSEGAPANLGEVVAFLGSAAEVISTNLELGTLNSVLAEGDSNKMLIMPHQTVYLGVELDPAKTSWWASQPNPIELFAEGKMAEISEAEELLKQKVNLLNLLLEAFGAGGDKAEEWKQMLEHEFKNVDAQGRVDRMIEAGMGTIAIRPGVKTDITKKEVGDAFEKLVNLTCKKAIASLGFVEVKQKFQSVISRLAAEKR